MSCGTFTPIGLYGLGAIEDYDLKDLHQSCIGCGRLVTTHGKLVKGKWKIKSKWRWFRLTHYLLPDFVKARPFRLFSYEGEL